MGRVLVHPYTDMPTHTHPSIRRIGNSTQASTPHDGPDSEEDNLSQSGAGWANQEPAQNAKAVGMRNLVFYASIFINTF